ncbi:amino acid ABC transporter membrane protein, PAAT family [Desulfoscipio geothermicus DSM 3669]|uniref:Amino acid ABC transporter membrane protein, PAAT family n=1 Tax=Desulfoscipio geothermicus DSM 3669 TaxID=1121426 RepID=A0A1I6EJC7_9FIRM|nr:amino acid ABC transporter permease [Desulfoscipio geothermicus]SFR17864.1 amino acid ABC transporter membrane protein, PAAT family [Desulfoscipio geothermicus DSM 3669]
MDVVIENLPVLIFQGAKITLQITIISVAIGCLLGLIGGLSRLSRRKVLRFLATAYVDFFRGTPLLVQIFIVYFGIPKLLMDLQSFMVDSYGMTPVADSFALPRFLAAVIACSLNSGAYVAEIFRAGVQSIERGQMEAARSLGMTHGQAMRYVILPQAFKRVIPPLGNEFIAMLKDTSLLSVIGFAELTRNGQLIIARTYESFAIWLTVGFIYLIMTFTLSRIVDYLERRYKTGD